MRLGVKLFVIIVVSLAVTLSQKNASALSCSQPSIVAVDTQADVIFIGDLVSKDIETSIKDGSRTYTLSRYKVREAIRGVSNDDTVTVYYDTTWGDIAPGYHNEGTLVVAANGNFLSSIDCIDWLPMKEDTARNYGYTSLDFLKRDIVLLGTNTRLNEKKSLEQIPQNDSSSTLFLVLVSTTSTLVGSAVTLLVMNKKYKNSK